MTMNIKKAIKEGLTLRELEGSELAELMSSNIPRGIYPCVAREIVSRLTRKRMDQLQKEKCIELLSSPAFSEYMSLAEKPLEQVMNKMASDRWNAARSVLENANSWIKEVKDFVDSMKKKEE